MHASVYTHKHHENTVFEQSHHNVQIAGNVRSHYRMQSWSLILAAKMFCHLCQPSGGILSLTSHSHYGLAWVKSTAGSK